MNRALRLAVPAALAGLVISAFLPALDGEFVNWDDYENFRYNPHFHGLGLEPIAWAWTQFRIGVYQPLAWMLLEGEYALWGLDPWGYHLTSLLLHVANSIVFYALIVAVLGRCRPAGPGDRSALVAAAALAAALFAVHPLRVEVVAWASCQPYLPCVLFAMLAVLAYLRAHDGGRRRHWPWLVAAGVLTAAALLCKAVAVGLPLVLLILDVYPLRRLGPGHWLDPSAREALREKAPFLALGVTFAVVAVLGKRDNETLAGDAAMDALGRWLQACYAASFYVVKTLVPTRLVAFYPLPPRSAFLGVGTLWSLPAVAAAVAIALASRRRWPGLLAAGLVSLILLAPNLGLVRVGRQVAADRYSYAASLAAMISIAAVLRGPFSALGTRPRAAFATAVVAVAVLSGLVGMTRRQCRTWRDSQALWVHCLAAADWPSPEAHIGLGAFLAERGQYRPALRQYVAAWRLEPANIKALTGIGVALASSGRDDEAASSFLQALRLDPKSAEAHVNLGAVLLRRGDAVAAERHYRAALASNPDFLFGHYNLAVLLARQGSDLDAMEHYRAALEIDPDFADAHYNLALLYARRGRAREAIAHYGAVVRLEPRSADARQGLGVLLLRQGRAREAKVQFAAALRIAPGHEGARLGLIEAARREGPDPPR